jgi:hypothetical protein
MTYNTFVFALFFVFCYSSCWAFIDVSPSRIRQIVLFSSSIDPATIFSQQQVHQLDNLVNERSEARWIGNYTHADLVRDEIQSLGNEQFEIVVTDLPRSAGGGSLWKLVPTESLIQKNILEGSTILQLAHAALGLAVESSEQANLGRAHTALLGETAPQSQTDNNEEKLLSITQQIQVRLQHESVDLELAGRKSADAAFWLALAGVAEENIFDSLTEIATRELSRFGQRSSCRTKHIYQILERFAAAGLAPKKLAEIANACLQFKGVETEKVTFSSDRSLLLLWKFSTKQKKQRAFLSSALKHWQQQHNNNDSEQTSPSLPNIKPSSYYQWNSMFADPKRPLVVDVGCGMGVSLLGLARSKESNKILLNTTKWEDCNFVGVDLGGLGIGYARGLSHRWGVSDRLQFVVDSAEHALSQLESYPGPVQLCLVQFPTPYQLNRTKNGNSQLPISANDGFMVSQNLLLLVKDCIGEGKVLLQSNCEDVAIYMKTIACRVGLETFDYESQATEAKAPTRIPQRTLDWIALSNPEIRATPGQGGWSRGPLLHREGQTETEVACELNSTPVHRCVLRQNTR